MEERQRDVIALQPPHCFETLRACEIWRGGGRGLQTVVFSFVCVLLADSARTAQAEVTRILKDAFAASYEHEKWEWKVSELLSKAGK